MSLGEQIGIGVGAVVATTALLSLAVWKVPSLNRAYVQKFGRPISKRISKQKYAPKYRSPPSVLEINQNPYHVSMARIMQLQQSFPNRSIDIEMKKKEFRPVRMNGQSV